MFTASAFSRSSPNGMEQVERKRYSRFHAHLSGCSKLKLFHSAQVKEVSVLFGFPNPTDFAAKAPLTRADKNTGCYVFELSSPFSGVSQESGGPVCHPKNGERTVALNPTLSEQFDSFSGVFSLVKENRGVLSHWLFSRPRRILVINTLSLSLSLWPF